MLNGGGCSGGKYVINICIGHVMIGWRAERLVKEVNIHRLRVWSGGSGCDKIVRILKIARIVRIVRIVRIAIRTPLIILLRM